MRQLAILARARPIDIQAEKKPPAPPPESFHYRAHDVSFLTDSISGIEPLYHPESLADLIRANIDPDAWHDERARLTSDDSGFLEVTARSTTQSAVKGWVDKALAEEARLAILDLRILDGPMEILQRLTRNGGGFQLPAGWLETEDSRKLREIFRVYSAGLTRGRRKLWGCENRSFVAGVDSVCGGAAVIHVLPDPAIGSLGSGFILEASLIPLHGQGIFALDMTLALCRGHIGKSAKILASADFGADPQAIRDSKGSPQFFPKGESRRIAMPLTLDLPEQEVWTCSSDLTLRAGQPVLLKLEAFPEHQGRMTVAALRVVQNQ